MTEPLPVSALLSQALVAFTVEFDNEFEHRMPHRTTNHGRTAGTERVPWLVSMPMWVHCMRHVPAGGIPAAGLARRAGLPAKTAAMLLTRMSKWWGYLSVKPDPDDPRAKPPPAAWVVRPTRAGRQAQEVWAPLERTIDERWQARFGAEVVEGLRGALSTLVAGLDEPLQAYLPFGELRRPTGGEDKKAIRRAGGDPGEGEETSLPALLSTALAAFQRAFDTGAGPALAYSANVIRVLDDEGIPARDLPELTGIAPMGVDNALAVLGRSGYLAVSSPGPGRPKVVRPTPKGAAARQGYADGVSRIEAAWATRLPAGSVAAVRRRLEALAGGGTAADSPLWTGLEPYPDGWRAQVPRPLTLPHYPVVSHRGGFPDGS